MRFHKVWSSTVSMRRFKALTVDTQKQCNQLFSQHTVDMNILMLYVFLVLCECRYRLSTAVRINPYSARC